MRRLCPVWCRQRRARCVAAPHALIRPLQIIVNVRRPNRRAGLSGLLQEEIKLVLQLSAPLRELQDGARHIAAVSTECKLEVDSGG